MAIDPPTGNWTEVAKEQVPTTTTLEIYLHQTTNQLPNYMRVLDMRTDSAEGYETGQIIIELGGIGKQVTYFLKDSSTIWGVSFFAQTNEFELYLPIFETSVRTLRTQRTQS